MYVYHNNQAVLHLLEKRIGSIFNVKCGLSFTKWEATITASKFALFSECDNCKEEDEKMKLPH